MLHRPCSEGRVDRRQNRVLLQQLASKARVGTALSRRKQRQTFMADKPAKEAEKSDQTRACGSQP